jgi:Na+:H+ antiporter
MFSGGKKRIIELMFGIVALLLTAAAFFSYIAARYTRFPSSIVIMALAMASSLLFVALGQFGFAGGENYLGSLLQNINFSKTFLAVTLGYLLFAGALQVDLSEVMEKKIEIVLFSTLGVIISTVIVGVLTYYSLQLLGLGIGLAYCFLFGALISPTDPVSVLAILKSVGAPRGIQVNISGESLFNDGVGVVLFLLISGIIAGSHFTWGGIAGLFLLETFGGAVLGFLAGYVAYLFLKRAGDRKVELLITIALVTGGYALASQFYASGAIAMVVAGLLIGNHGRMFPVPKETRENIYGFWGLIDDLLNSLLFLVIGLEVLTIRILPAYILAGGIAVAIVLLARSASVASLVYGLKRIGKNFGKGVVRIMTWGGLRGGIPVALALATPPGREHDIIVTMTYVAVAFSIIVQGSSIKALVSRIYKPAQPAPPAPSPQAGVPA